MGELRSARFVGWPPPGRVPVGHTRLTQPDGLLCRKPDALLLFRLSAEPVRVSTGSRPATNASFVTAFVETVTEFWSHATKADRSWEAGQTLTATLSRLLPSQPALLRLLPSFKKRCNFPFSEPLYPYRQTFVPFHDPSGREKLGMGLSLCVLHFVPTHIGYRAGGPLVLSNLKPPLSRWLIGFTNPTLETQWISLYCTGETGRY